MQILREKFKDASGKGKSPKDVFVKAKKRALNNTMAPQHES